MNFDSNVLNIAIEDIVPNRFQPRLDFEDESLNDLAASIKEHGIIQPLVLRRIEDKYEIIAGERRYKAAKKAGLLSVPAVIAKIDDTKSAELAIAENVQRRELNAIEEALSYKSLLDAGYMNEEQLARKMGLGLNAIQNKLKLLELSQEVQDAVITNKISDKHAKGLLVIKDKKDQVNWLNRIINERLTVRELNEKIKEEYKESNMNIDNNLMTSEPINIAMPQSTSIGTKRSGTFFNSLEDEEVNMEMTEAINPLSSNFNPNLTYGFEVASNKEKELNEKIEENIDSLDINPTSEEKVEIEKSNIQEAEKEINDLVNKLKEKYNITINTTDAGSSKVFTIIVNE